ncbi:ABC transporter permease [Thermococcus thioreducens]|uniref:ABC transporter permease n=1 Tax=Thermococcus thioreducens TaxID=277988 RepID=A0A0Q2XP83_9EURY|nr:ABC transporter permease [Thermococcus thioreducens]ASJ12361.1 ABC transporter permease [Thermococcus thioreducens]KQH83092.1 ABC transporter permease [Thermococcus thioreducens]SEV92166.1 nucleoside ABC transporter membrane protein [Thermococcus thioreducens]
MDLGSIISILITSLMAMVPIVLTSVGAVWSERAGVVSIGYEGVLLMSAFFGAIVAEVTGSGIMGLVGGIATGVIFGMLHGVLTVYLKGDHVIPGIGINLLAMGVVPFGILAYWGTAGQHQVAVTLWSWNTKYGKISPMIFVTIAISVITWWVLFKTPLGLRVRSVGENPEAADALGINVEKYRFWSTVYGHALAGLGGAYMSVAWLGVVQKTMSAGRGFIALANMVFSGWNPLVALLGGWLFGFFDALAAWLAPLHIIPGQFILMLPYIMTLIIVAGIIGKARPPKWDGRPYKRE